MINDSLFHVIEVVDAEKEDSTSLGLREQPITMYMLLCTISNTVILQWRGPLEAQ